MPPHPLAGRGGSAGKGLLIFLYLLSARWLSAHGLGTVDPAKVAQLDSVEHINDLVSVGGALAEEVKLEYLALNRLKKFY